MIRIRRTQRFLANQWILEGVYQFSIRFELSKLSFYKDPKNQTLAQS